VSAITISYPGNTFNKIKTKNFKNRKKTIIIKDRQGILRIGIPMKGENWKWK